MKSSPDNPSGIIQPGNEHLRVCYSGDIENSADETSNQPETPAPISESVCAFCKQDFLGMRLNKLSVYPICESCKSNLDKKIFPLWVKLFFAGVLLLVAFSVFWNYRFYSGYRDIKASIKTHRQGNVARAAFLMTRASNEVPESKDVSMYASFYTGIDLLQKDKSTDALAQFENCKDLDSSFHVNLWVLQAEMGSGFDKKDYKLFLSAAKANLKTDTTVAIYWADVASAYACLYTQNAADSLKQQSLKYYGKAKEIDDTSATAKEFYGRILYRLDSHMVISMAEFDKKFPKGYTSNNLK